MFVKKNKRCIISSLLVFAVILSCGCQKNADDIPQISDGGVSLPPQENMTDSGDIVTTIPDNSDIVTTSAVTTEKDIEFTPDEWIYIYDALGALTSFNEIVNADCSEGNISDIICSLVHKNELFYLTRLGCTYEVIDRDNPITYGDDEITLYPAVSVFFPDVKSIYELACSVYGSSADHIYTYDPSTNSFYWPIGDELRLFFTEIDGQMYVNLNCGIFKGGPFPFISSSSYIEITEQSEDRCSLVWHYPDVERLREQDKYVGYYYYEKNFTAVYSEGAWRLTEVICY